MKKSDLIKFMRWYAEQNKIDDPKFAEDWVSDYFESFPLNKTCECINPTFVKGENYSGEMVDYCCVCKRKRF